MVHLTLAQIESSHSMDEKPNCNIWDYHSDEIGENVPVLKGVTWP